MNTKMVLLSTTALTLASAGMVVTVATPAAAADRTTFSLDPVSGYVEAFGGFGTKSFSPGSSSAGYTAVAGAGRLNWWLNPSVTLQIDGYGAGHDVGGDVPSNSAVAAHLAMKGMSNFNIAVMGSIGHAFGDRYTTLAVEGQMHGANWTVFGQAGVISPQSFTGGTTPYAMLEGRFFFNQNFMASADVTFASQSGVSGAFSSGTSYTGFGAMLEFRPMGMPLSVFARGQVNTLNFSSFKETDTSALFGFRLYANQMSLWANNLRGATYADRNPLYGQFATKFNY